MQIYIFFSIDFSIKKQNAILHPKYKVPFLELLNRLKKIKNYEIQTNSTPFSVDNQCFLL